MLQSASRQLVTSEREWSFLVNAKLKQIIEAEQVMQQVLMLCAESDTGTVNVEDIYTIMQGVRR